MKKKNYFSMKKGLAKAFLVLVALSASSFAFAVDITTGLKLHYDFEAVANGVVPDVSGNAQDGTVMGAAAVAPGYVGTGINFPTAAAPAVDYVQLPNGITADLTDFTVATWVKMDKVDWWMRIFDLGSSKENYIMCTAMGGNLKVEFKYNNAGGQFVDSPSPLPSGKWVHVALTCAYVDGNGTAKLYLNGNIVGTNTGITTTPSMLDALAPTTQNYIAKSQFDDNGLNGTVDEFRIYDRALTDGDVMTLSGAPAELITQWQNLILGNLSDVKTNLTLPTTMGTGGVTVKWASNNNGAIDTLGNVIIPPKYNAVVTLTATMSLKVDTTTYTLTKVFNANVLAVTPVPDEVAQWNFVDANISTAGGVVTVKDEFSNGFVGTVMNDARIRTIGTDTKFNVLDLGNGTGYFDMGTGIGEDVYSLKDKFTVGGYFRMDAGYPGAGDWGNNLFSFSNTADVLADPKGTMYACLGKTSYEITAGAWNSGGETGINPGKTPTTGTWHHYAYVQDGTVGSIYFDGALLSTGTVDAYPSNKLVREGKTGTLFNFIGRPPYFTADPYLKKTLVYGFSLYRIALTEGDMVDILNVPTIITDLNNAYAQDSDVKSPNADIEAAALTFDLSAVTSNLTLPTQGATYPTVAIAWKSSLPAVIGNDGVVTRPDTYNCSTVTLTATLTEGLAKAVKSFPATVVAKDGTQFTSADSLLVKFDFASATNDTVSTDAAEKHFTGIAKQGAKVKSIGTTAPVNILALGDSIGYFDMGTQMGSILNHLTYYTMGAFFRVDASYTELNKDGNFLWNFSNSNNAGSDANGYIFAGLKSQKVAITSKHWDGEQSVEIGEPALMGGWHHIAYTQEDTIGVVYIDGAATKIGTIKWLPKVALTKDGFIGTVYNWLGRSCWLPNGDKYLRKTLVSDFRIYNRALTADEIATTLMNVTATIPVLDQAYSETPMYSALKTVKESQYKVTSTQGKIQIIGLTGNEKVALYDITGRHIVFNSPNNISVKSGIYIVRINNFAAKVLVK